MLASENGGNQSEKVSLAGDHKEDRSSLEQGDDGKLIPMNMESATELNRSFGRQGEEGAEETELLVRRRTIAEKNRD